MEFLCFESLRHIPDLRHAITTRDGGVSAPPFNSLNLGFHVGDNADAVRENRRRVAGQLGFDEHHCIGAQQVHGSEIHIATPGDRGRGTLDWDSALPNTDAIITRHSDLPLWILVADCAPILIVDAEHQVLAVVHAGWRGAATGIAGRTIQRMRDEFGTAPQSTLIGIGPCLCVACLEVGEEVAAQVESTFIHRNPAGPHLDLRALIAADLMKQGIDETHIEILDECPRCNRSKYFSHRGNGGQTGRFGLVAWWE